MILLIDNYDSFTWNVYQLLAQLGADVHVIRNDDATVEQVAAMEPERVVISPGPGTPSDAGISCDVIRQLGPHTPVFGVCLGMQCIAEVYGAVVGRAGELVHGKTSPMTHGGAGVFSGIPSPFDAVRYHSLAVRPESVPQSLEVTATTTGGTIMGLRHREHPVEGVQFHPESILTEHGGLLLANVLAGSTTRDRGAAA